MRLLRTSVIKGNNTNRSPTTVAIAVPKVGNKAIMIRGAQGFLATTSLTDSAFMHSRQVQFSITPAHHNLPQRTRSLCEFHCTNPTILSGTQ